MNAGGSCADGWAQSADAEHGSLGLARRMESLSARLLILPGDPFATDLSFDEEFWGWWTKDGPSPFGTHVQWTNTEPTVDAAVKYERRLGEVDHLPRPASAWRCRGWLRSVLVG